MTDAPKQPVEATMKNRWLTAALCGSAMGFLYVAVTVISHALWAGWESVNQPGYWIDRAIGFLFIATLFTLLYLGNAGRLRK